MGKLLSSIIICTGNILPPPPCLAADLGGRGQYAEHWMNEGKERRWLILPTSIQILLGPRFQLAYFRGQKYGHHQYHHIKNTITVWNTPILSFKRKDNVTFIIKPWKQIRKWKQCSILDTVHWSLSCFNCFTPKKTVISHSECVLNRNIPNNPTGSQMPAFCFVRFLVLTVASTMMTAFWDIVLCSLVEVDWRFRGVYPLHHLVALIIKHIQYTSTRLHSAIF
jgi:hypothetical protein